MSSCGTARLKKPADTTLTHALVLIGGLNAAISESLTDEEQANINAGMAAYLPGKREQS
jgi:hypothetical protein